MAQGAVWVCARAALLIYRYSAREPSAISRRLRQAPLIHGEPVAYPRLS